MKKFFIWFFGVGQPWTWVDTAGALYLLASFTVTALGFWKLGSASVQIYGHL